MTSAVTLGITFAALNAWAALGDAIDRLAQAHRFRIAGLTSGNSYTYKWAWYRLGGTTGTLTLFTGGSGGTSGNTRMVVREM